MTSGMAIVMVTSLVTPAAGAAGATGAGTGAVVDRPGTAGATGADPVGAAGTAGAAGAGAEGACGAWTSALPHAKANSMTIPTVMGNQLLNALNRLIIVPFQIKRGSETNR